MRPQIFSLVLTAAVIGGCAGSPVRAMMAESEARKEAENCAAQSFSSFYARAQCFARANIEVRQKHGSPNVGAVMTAYGQLLPLAKQVDEGKLTREEYEQKAMLITGQAQQQATQAYSNAFSMNQTMMQAGTQMMQSQQQAPAYTPPTHQSVTCRDLGMGTVRCNSW